MPDGQHEIYGFTKLVISQPTAPQDLISLENSLDKPDKSLDLPWPRLQCHKLNGDSAAPSCPSTKAKIGDENPGRNSTDQLSKDPSSLAKLPYIVHLAGPTKLE
ncbi:hypothetical protein FALCPG4_009527 [Fusarium falciforme]